MAVTSRLGNSNLPREHSLLKKYLKRCRAILPCDPKFFLLTAEIWLGSNAMVNESNALIQQLTLAASGFPSFVGKSQINPSEVGCLYCVDTHFAKLRRAFLSARDAR